MDARQYLEAIGDGVKNGFAERRSLLSFHEYLDLFGRGPRAQARGSAQLSTAASECWTFCRCAPSRSASTRPLSWIVQLLSSVQPWHARHGSMCRVLSFTNSYSASVCSKISRIARSVLLSNTGEPLMPMIDAAILPILGAVHLSPPSQSFATSIQQGTEVRKVKPTWR